MPRVNFDSVPKAYLALLQVGDVIVAHLRGDSAKISCLRCYCRCLTRMFSLCLRIVQQVFVYVVIVGVYVQFMFTYRSTSVCLLNRMLFYLAC